MIIFKLMYNKEVELFIDSVRALWHSLQTTITQIVIARKSLTTKLQLITIELLSHKLLTFNKLSNLLTTNHQSIKTLQQELNEGEDKLLKLKLHHFLAEKLKKMKKQSFVDKYNDQIDHLNTSVILIQKQLGINDDDDSMISDVVHKSILTLQNHSFIQHQSINESHLSIPSPKYSTNQLTQSVLDISDLKSETEKVQKKEAKKPPLPNNKMKRKSSKGQILGNLLQQSYKDCNN